MSWVNPHGPPTQLTKHLCWGRGTRERAVAWPGAISWGGRARPSAVRDFSQSETPSAAQDPRFKLRVLVGFPVSMGADLSLSTAVQCSFCSPRYPLFHPKVNTAPGRPLSPSHGAAGHCVSVCSHPQRLRKTSPYLMALGWRGPSLREGSSASPGTRLSALCTVTCAHPHRAVSRV